MENIEAKSKNKRNIDDSPSDNLFNLAKEAGYKKIMVKRESWPFGNWCIVNLMFRNVYDDFGSVYGHTKLSNGDNYHGLILDSDKDIWKLISVLKEDMIVHEQNMPKYKVNDSTSVSCEVKLMFRQKGSRDHWSVWGEYVLTPQQMERILHERNKESVCYEWKFAKVD